MVFHDQKGFGKADIYHALSSNKLIILKSEKHKKNWKTYLRYVFVLAYNMSSLLIVSRSPSVVHWSYELFPLHPPSADSQKGKDAFKS
jgi:hypothetical protein